MMVAAAQAEAELKQEALWHHLNVTFGRVKIARIDLATLRLVLGISIEAAA